MSDKIQQPYIFISHSSADNARIRPILCALIEAGLPLWIDTPEAYRLNINRNLFLGCLKEGERWSDNVLQAIAASSAVIVFPSPTAVKSFEVARECGFAQSQKHQRSDQFLLLAALLSDGDASSEQILTQGLHAFTTTVEEAEGGNFILTERGVKGITTLIARLTAHLQKVSPALINRGADDDGIDLDYDVPFLADRAVQIDLALASFRQTDAPPALVVHGQLSETPHRFTSVNLTRRVVATNSMFRYGGATSAIIRVRWPAITGEDDEQIHLSFARSILEKLPAADTVDRSQKRNSLKDHIRAIADAIGVDETTRIIATRLDATGSSSKSLVQIVKLWSSFWDSFSLQSAKTETHFLFIPILEIIYPDPPPFNGLNLNWLTSFGKSPRLNPQIIAKSIPSYTNIRLKVLPALSPITKNCVADWVATDDLFKTKNDAWRDELVSNLCKVFPHSNSEMQLPMRDWADLSKPVLRSAGIK